MGAAVLVNGSIILAVALSPLIVKPGPPRVPVTGESIELQPPPLEPEIEKKQDAPKLAPIFVPKPINDNFVDQKTPVTTSDDQETTTTVTDGGGGDDDMSNIIHEVPKYPVPIFRAALRDPSFARSFQPDYPVGLLQREIEGSVTVRVLIGTDGRVRQVQILRTTDPDFAKATEKQAIRAWRFKPATRDGVPVEDWQTLTVRFDINS